MKIIGGRETGGLDVPAFSPIVIKDLRYEIPFH